MMPKPKYTDFKFEDFQKSEMIMDFSNDGDFQAEVTATIKDGVMLILKVEAKQST